MRFKKSLPFVALLASFHCVGQIYPQNNFVLTAIPQLNSNQWIQLNRSNQSFAVSVVEGKLRIANATFTEARPYTLPQGKLLAMDRGEWGGGLYFSPNDADKKSLIVNGKQIFNVVDQLKSNFSLPGGDPARKLLNNKEFLIAAGNTSFVVA